MFRSIAAAIAAITLSLPVSAHASSLPGISDSYEGNYMLANAFASHGLYLPGFLGDYSWSIESGTAEYQNGQLNMAGTVKQTEAGSDYFMDFDFKLLETTDAPNGLVCGEGKKCNDATKEMRDNIVFFDPGKSSIMGTVTGTGVLAGLSMDITMRPLSGSNDDGTPKRKPGQLGYGGNWKTLDFGYSNWLYWDVTSAASNGYKTKKTSGKGDFNVNLVPAPVPAGFPLVLTGIAGFYAARRRQKARA